MCHITPWRALAVCCTLAHLGYARCKRRHSPALPLRCQASEYQRYASLDGRLRYGVAELCCCLLSHLRVRMPL